MNFYFIFFFLNFLFNYEIDDEIENPFLLDKTLKNRKDLIND